MCQGLHPAPSVQNPVRPQQASTGAWGIPGHPARFVAHLSSHLSSCRSHADRRGGSCNQTSATAAWTSMEAHEAARARAPLGPDARPAGDSEPSKGLGSAPSPAPPSAPGAAVGGRGAYTSLPDSPSPPPVCAAEWRLRAPDSGPLALLPPGRSEVDARAPPAPAPASGSCGVDPLSPLRPRETPV